MKKITLFLLILLILFSVGCSQKTEFVNPDNEDFLAWTKAYLDASEALSSGGSVKEYKKAIKDIVGEELLKKRVEAANKSVADVEIDGKVYSGQEKFKFIFGNDAKRIKMSIDISRVYDDLDQNREFYKYVIVEQRISVFNEEDEEITDKSIPKSNSTNLSKYWFQKLNDRWSLYSVENMRYLSDENGDFTRAEFNGEPVNFSHYKDYEIILN